METLPVTVVIPAYNEEDGLGPVVERVRHVLTEAGYTSEILVVVDGAKDGTAKVARRVADQVIEHPKNLGYGRSLKTGILAARYDVIAITDADGTYPVERLPEMLKLAERFHMVVGARTGTHYMAGPVKQIGRFVFRQLSEFAAGTRIPDINSGLRVFRRQHILPFFPVISAGYSFTTTSTLAFLLNDLFVHYIPIDYYKRTGSSKVRHVRDAIRALQIITEAILRINPIKMFLLLALPFGLAGGLLMLIGLIWSSTLVVVGGIWAGAAGLLLGMGFLAVSMSPGRRLADPRFALPPNVVLDRKPESES